MTMTSNLEHNITPFLHHIRAEDRAKIKNQSAVCIWLTGLSGSGKSTIANALDTTLHKSGFHTFILDGDNIRNGLCKDLGFSQNDRAENIRRIAEVAYLMQQSGLIVIVAFISPFRSEREFARSLFQPNEFFEVYLNTPLPICEARDPKGIYKKMRKGLIKQFTGVDSPYEVPHNPDLTLNTEDIDVESCIAMIIDRFFR